MTEQCSATAACSTFPHQDQTSSDIAERVRIATWRKRDSYAYPWLRRGYMIQFREIEYAVLKEVRRCTGGSLAGCRILDIGCGVGGWLREFVKWGADPESLYGIDAMPERIKEARKLSPRGIHLICGNATELEFPDESFDLIMMFQSMCLMLDDNSRQAVAKQSLRVLRPGGAILWYDHRYRRPGLGDVLRPVSRKEIRRLFPGCKYHIKTIHPFPPLARRLTAISPLAWSALNLFPPLRLSYFGSIRKPPALNKDRSQSCS